MPFTSFFHLPAFVFVVCKVLIVFRAFGTCLFPADMPQRRFTLSTALRMLRLELLAIREMHNSGWLHRDLSPGNFLIDMHGYTGRFIKMNMSI